MAFLRSAILSSPPGPILPQPTTPVLDDGCAPPSIRQEYRFWN
jgi:hypothetical protein